MDIEIGLQEGEKVDIECFFNPEKQARSPRHHILRSRDHVRITDTRDVERTAKPLNLNVKHIVKIFTDDNEFIQVTPEDVERVKMMHEKFESGASFSFNYNTLLLVASVLAGLGLVSDSATIIVASMLVSPIMGPVVGLAYGTTIHDWKLVRLSLRNECLSLLFCITMGVVITTIAGVTPLADEWITDEMKSRTAWSTFFVGLPVAFFSGLGVAVSLLDDQTSSLVGVAISASLLPPAVNSGALWVYYAYVEHGIIYRPDDAGYDALTKGGVLSLLLTISNIFLIWIASMLMFRMKEVLPIEKKVFWEDIGLARKIYQHKALLQLCQVPVDASDESVGQDNIEEMQETSPLGRKSE